MIESIMAISVLSLFLLARNFLAYKLEMRALNMVHTLAVADIEAGRHDWQRHYDRLEQHSHEWLMFNLLVWTSRQAHPWLYDIHSPSEK